MQPSRTCFNGARQATWEKGYKPLSVTSSVEDSLNQRVRVEIVKMIKKITVIEFQANGEGSYVAA